MAGNQGGDPFLDRWATVGHCGTCITQITMIYANQNILIIGLGVSGRAAASFLLKHGAKVIGVDRDRDLLLNHVELEELKQKGLQVSHESEKLDMGHLILLSSLPECHRPIPFIVQLMKPISR